ncbi:hypothetical protein, partial [Streptosporangium sandarakinum]
ALDTSARGYCLTVERDRVDLPAGFPGGAAGPRTGAGAVPAGPPAQPAQATAGARHSVAATARRR